MEKDINRLISEHYGFIIKAVSDTTGRYVSIENDDAFSVGLLAFQEAVEKHDEAKGPFLAFAKLVISSRVIDHLRKENKHNEVASLDQLEDAGLQVHDPLAKQEEEMALEIEKWKFQLRLFGITLDQLVDESPKHQDTRDRAIAISERSSQHEPITTHLFEKKRLPIKNIALFNRVSEKIIKGSKTFITSTIIIYKKEYQLLVAWIKR